MIEINLLPEELRVKTKAKVIEHETVTKPGNVNLERLFVYAIPVLLGVLVCVHIYFIGVSTFKNGQLASLNRKWKELAPQKKALDKFNLGYSSSSADANLLRELNSKKLLWAQKLNKLSLSLPAGVWFNEIKVSEKAVIIQGSVISLTKEEVNLINKLLENLKADSEFSKDFSTFELSNVQKREVGGYGIADFILTGALIIK